jgi:hypothetical protein
MSERKKPGWRTIVFRSSVVAAAAVAGLSYWRADALLLLAALFSLGFIAGLWSRRHGWLAGVVVGFPASFLQMARWAKAETGSFDWWVLAFPAGIVAAGMAVVGGMTGAWLRDMKLLKEEPHGSV